MQQGDAMKEAVTRIASLEERAQNLTLTHAETRNSLAATQQNANDLDERMAGLRQLLTEVSQAKDEVAKLSGPAGMVTKIKEQITRLGDQIAEVESRGDGLRDVAFRVDVAETRAKEVTDEQIELAKTLEKTMRGVEDAEAKFAELSDLEGRVSELRGDVEGLTVARQEAAELLGPSGLMVNLRTQSEELHETLSKYHGEVARVREDQSHIQTSQETALSTYDDVSSRLDKLTEKISHESERVSTVQATMSDLAKAEELAARTERHLNALRALADHVTLKSAALETQREVVDRAESQLRNLSDIQQSLGWQVKKAQDQVKEVKKAHAGLGGLQTLNSEVAGRTAKLRDAQAKIESDNHELQQQLDRLQEAVRLGDERFRLDSSNLEAVGQRITHLRNGATQLESRFRTLDNSVGRITEANDQANAVAARITTVSSELAQFGEQIERVDAMHEGMSRTEHTAAEIEKRLERIEAARGEIDEAVRDVASLRGSREEVRDALELLRGARAEIERMQVGHTETSAWLATVQDSIRETRGKIALLDDLAGNVEHMRQNADRVVSAASNLDARRESLAVLEARMFDLQRTGTQLDERTSNLLTSLDDAEQRFTQVAKQANAADKVSDVITSVSASVEQAERRMSDLGEGVESVAGRAEQVQAMSKQVERVAGEIEQRQQALTAAAEQLERVTALRSEAAEVVQSLEEQLGTLTAELRTAEKQSEKVGSHAERLEARAGSLRFAEKRLTQFEEKLAQLDQTEQELARSLETLVARQESVDAVRKDVQELFGTAERTLNDVRAISAARDDVEEARGAMDLVLSKAAEMERVLAQIEEHQKQIEALRGASRAGSGVTPGYPCRSPDAGQPEGRGRSCHRAIGTVGLRSERGRGPARGASSRTRNEPAHSRRGEGAAR